MDWFEQITGFPEASYAQTQSRLSVIDGALVSPHSPRRPKVGQLETPSLAELRARVAALPSPLPKGGPTVSWLQADARQLHAQPESAGALFQVASQFNLLEMTGPSVRPQDGVTRYAGDPTQGPACAMAAGAATIYRNYLHPVDGQPGQGGGRQVDCLHDLGALLGNAAGRFWKMQNGYPLMLTREGLHTLDAQLAALDDAGRDALKAALRIGLHWGVEVTDIRPVGHRVSQAFCSALPIAYQDSLRDGPWQRFAALVLEASYEATLLAGVLNLARVGCAKVFLTRVGAGAFGNRLEWVEGAMEVGLGRVAGVGLEVVVVER